MPKPPTTPTNTKSITITPTHTLVGTEAIPIEEIEYIHIVMEDGTFYTLDTVLKALDKYATGTKAKRPWKITTKLKAARAAFKAATIEVQQEQDDQRWRVDP